MSACKWDSGVSVEERARRYVRQMDGAIQGAHGSTATFKAAMALRVGFCLSEDEALRILTEEHNPKCSPPWSARELRHKLRSAAASCTQRAGYLLEGPEREQRVQELSRSKPAAPERLEPASFHNVASALLELCPLDGQPDVFEYVMSRRLVIGATKAQCAALPPPFRQAPLLAELAGRFGADTLVRAGLVHQPEGGAPDLRRLVFAENRLVLPWRAPNGSIDTLQRRRIDQSDARKYVFATGRKPLYPFGVEQLAHAATDVALAFCEGALDAMALRLLAHRDALTLIPLAVPGVDGWNPAWARFAKGRRALVALDADVAGEGRRKRMVADLYAAGALEVHHMRPRGGAKDWAEMLQGAGE